MGLFAGTKWDVPAHCHTCGELEENCTCPPPVVERKPPSKQTARIAIEKRKKGKAVVVVRDLSPEDNDLSELLTTLKTACGSGGTLKDGVLEIQGRQLERVREKLQEIGYKVKG